MVPVYNERENIAGLAAEVVFVMKGLGSFELIFADDGSRDGTARLLEEMHRKDKRIKAVFLRKNFGQSAALDAGIGMARGGIIITMDGDGQNDPRDIPRLLSKLAEGYDVVSGWRLRRKDRLEKRIFSGAARMLRSLVLKDRIHDSGCSLKAYRRECFSNFNLYGEMHRYIAELLAVQGFRIGEVKVRHRERRHGTSKYNTKRVLKGFVDLFLIWFLRKYEARPLHLFGGLGIASIAAGGALFAYVMALKLFRSIDLSSHFLSYLSVFMVVVGVQFFVSGIMTDMISRGQERKFYQVRKFLK